MGLHEARDPSAGALLAFSFYPIDRQAILLLVLEEEEEVRR